MNSQVNITNSNSKIKSKSDCIIDPKNSCCFSGHRIIRHDDKDIIRHNLPVLLERLYQNGINTFIAGGALGFDTIAAFEVIKLRNKYGDVRLILALPCKDQASKWTAVQKSQYNKILNSADEVLYISENYLPGCMQKRNRFMVDISMTVIVYIQNASSGTGYTTKYALDNEREVINVITDM